jgi:predicted RNase H-like HicB family nuclease
MTGQHYIALVHKETASGYGVSFPDVPGVIAVADTLDGAIVEAAAALGFAFEEWDGSPPAQRTLEELRQDPDFLDRARDAVVIAVRPNAPVYEAAE